MTESNSQAKVGMLIRKPVSTVFEAFTNPAITTKFWFTKSTGELEEGKQINWIWEMYNLTVPLTVKKIDLNERIIIEWGEGKHKSTVKWEFKPIHQSNTFVTITNYDFQCSGDELISEMIDSTGGFNLVIAGLKAWLEHRVQLNLIADKFPKELMDETVRPNQS